jgi:hypothetical protein
MPFENSFCAAGVHREIVSGPELDQSKFCQNHFDFLFVSVLLCNDLFAAHFSLRPKIITQQAHLKSNLQLIAVTWPDPLAKSVGGCSLI